MAVSSAKQVGKDSNYGSNYCHVSTCENTVETLYIGLSTIVPYLKISESESVESLSCY